MKKYFLMMLILLILKSISAQEQSISLELYLENQTETPIIYAKVYPVSTFVNGDNEVSLLAHCYNPSEDRLYSYLSGVYNNYNTKKYYIEVYNGLSQQGLNWDIESPPPPYYSFGSVARGIYRIEFWKLVQSEYEFLGYTYYEIDGGGEKNDIRIGYTEDLSPYEGQGAGLYYSSTILGLGWGPTWAVSKTNYYIKYWDLYPGSSLPSRSKNYGNYNYGATTNPYNRLPLFGNYDCNLSGYPEQNQIIPLNEIYNAGKVPLNITFKKNISTPIDWNWGNNTEGPPITIMAGANLKISSGTNEKIKFTMNPYSGSLYGTKLFVEPGAHLILESSSGESNKSIIEVQNKCEINSSGILFLGNYSNIEIKYGGRVYLQSQSEVRALVNSKITVYPGGIFCNYGAYISGILRVEYLGGPHAFCYSQPDVVFDDSTQIILKDTATLEIPNNVTITFRNPESSLYLDSNSTILMGTNSKLVFEDGAKLFAYKTKFKCSDTTATWDGIYLSDFSNDTIKNCIIENADNGINVQDRYTVATQPEPNTEISNCTFRNLINSNLTNGIYIYNSNNVLIRNNTFEAPNQNAGFSTGILVEYCPAGNINIINNNIDYAETGISVIQSSPYIYKNTITGRQNARIGIFLDNSNCNIKNNTIENFQNSISLYYSSPYLFQNELNNALGSNLYLQSNSTPLLGPVTSQSTANWLGGNNRIAGYPNTAGIEFYNDSYPEMIDGYNIDSVNGSNYLTGTIPDALNGALNVTNNNWDDSIPVSNKFAVSNGSVMYNPTYNGITPIDYDNFDLYNIGFGLYDTVLTKDLSNLSPGGNVLFMQAYKREKQKDYISAVLLYKQVINNFNKSFYAAASIERIFNCLEKSQFNFILYYSYQSYLIQIKNNDKYPSILRELAEDYIIKCKIKRRLFIEAIADYQNMFEENLNKPKGLHAFLNKECVLAMLIDTSRNSVISQFTLLNLHKQNLLAVINQQRLTTLGMKTGNETPKSFKLEQNYPNPFNPVTNIKYELPKDVLVTIKIYDILGREIKTLVNDFQRTGEYVISFNGNNIASGVYFYRIVAGEFNSVKRMVLIK
jgi:parallel beta-helix repeat protein